MRHYALQKIVGRDKEEIISFNSRIDRDKYVSTHNYSNAVLYNVYEEHPHDYVDDAEEITEEEYETEC